MTPLLALFDGTGVYEYEHPFEGLCHQGTGIPAYFNLDRNEVHGLCCVCADLCAPNQSTGWCVLDAVLDAGTAITRARPESGIPQQHGAREKSGSLSIPAAIESGRRQ